jgi:uridylate kinase
VTELRYRRILLKLSGEALAGDKGFGFDFSIVGRLADEVKRVADMGVAVGMVVGGGNIVRGSQLAKLGMDRVSSDYMGMLGTVRMEEVAEPYIRRRALRHFEKGRTVIFAAGTGNPYFSTDTAAVLRAIQMKADVIIKATSVEGVYTADPKTDPSAKFYETITYRDVMLQELRVMDQTAITLCAENKLPLIVLNIHKNGAVASAVSGERVGTLVQ